MQVKAPVSHHHTPARMANISRLTTSIFHIRILSGSVYLTQENNSTPARVAKRNGAEYSQFTVENSHGTTLHCGPDVCQQENRYILVKSCKKMLFKNEKMNSGHTHMDETHRYNFKWKK